VDEPMGPGADRSVTVEIIRDQRRTGNTHGAPGRSDTGEDLTEKFLGTSRSSRRLCACDPEDSDTGDR